MTIPTENAETFCLSVVMPCYNAEAFLAETLDSLAAQEFDGQWEFVFVNNRSTDNSVAIANSYKDRIKNLRIITADKGQGTAYSVNAGVEAAKADYVIFCDSDDIPQPGWLKAMAKAASEYDFIACKMEVVSLNPINTLGSRPTPQAKGLMKISYPPYLHHAGGSTLGIKRQIFLDVGGYNPEFVYLHETDFCFRTQLAGHTLTFVPDAVLSIRFRTKRKPTFWQSYHWGQYNVLLFKTYKHLGPLPKQRWYRLWQESYSQLHTLVKWKTLDKGEKMRRIWLAGWYVGKISGILKHRCGPY